MGTSWAGDEPKPKVVIEGEPQIVVLAVLCLLAHPFFEAYRAQYSEEDILDGPEEAACEFIWLESMIVNSVLPHFEGNKSRRNELLMGLLKATDGKVDFSDVFDTFTERIKQNVAERTAGGTAAAGAHVLH